MTFDRVWFDRGLTVRLTKRQVSQELRRLGLAWGRLPPGQAPVLAELWEAHQGDRKEERYHVIAAKLPGGWSAKQVGVEGRGEGGGGQERYARDNRHTRGRRKGVKPLDSF